MSLVRAILLWLGIALTHLSLGQDVSALYNEAAKAYEAKNFATFVERTRAMLTARPRHQVYTYNLAAGFALTDHKTDALALLNQAAAMGFIYPDIAKDSDFASLRGSPDFDAVLKKFADNQRPIVQSEKAFAIREKGLVPEGLAYDPGTKTFFVGSVYRRKIIAVNERGEARDFSRPSDGLWSVMGMKVDAKRRLLWVCTAGHKQMMDAKPEDDGKTAVFKYGLPGGKLLKKYAVPDDGRKHWLGDLTIDSHGTVYASDSVSPNLYFVAPAKDEIELLRAGPPFVNLQGLALNADETRLLVADYLKGFFLVDLQTKEVTPLSVPENVAAQGCDGIYRVGNDIVAVQNGIRPNRVVRLRMSPDLRAIEKLDVLEANNPVFDEPTLGVVLDHDFYFNAKSQWGAIYEDGTLAPVERLQGSGRSPTRSVAAALCEAPLTRNAAHRAAATEELLKRAREVMLSAMIAEADEVLQFDAIDDVLRDIAAGRMVIVTDDADRENEGDLIMAAEKVTPQAVNFMTMHGRGLICVPTTNERAEHLGLSRMVAQNREMHRTDFTVSVDAAKGVTTGISTHDRAATIQTIANPKSIAEDLVQPGHVFPLRAKDGGVLRRAGHTEAAVDLARLGGLNPAGVLCEILHDDGTMARLPELMEFKKKHGLRICTIQSLIAYRRVREKLVEREQIVSLPTDYGTFELHLYRSKLDGAHHLALVKGKISPDEPTLVRVHSECLTGDVFGSRRCDCGNQLHAALRQIAEEGRGVLVYMRQEGRGIGLAAKIHAYKLQEEGLDTVEANAKLGFPSDLRDYGLGAQILFDLGVRQFRFLTNNPKKVVGLEGYGIQMIEQVPIRAEANPHNAKYLETKKVKMGHLL